MPPENTLEHFDGKPGEAQLAAGLLAAMVDASDVTALLEQAVPRIHKTLDSKYLAMLRPEEGAWKTVTAAGAGPSVPTELLAEALDSGRPQQAGQWAAAPLQERAEGGALLVAQFARDDSAAVPSLVAAALLLGAVVTIASRQQTQDRRVRRLEAILEFAGQWNQTHEMEGLLVQMAETSTRLLGAERASIFLWDQPNKMLVGRPALGVEGGELRIPDDRGIVGQVIQSGEPRRVDCDRDQDQINREVDKQLSFQTDTLLCVPLRGRSGQLFGAFEMINKLKGDFTREDEAGLVELASHAAIALENTQEYEQLLNSRRQIAEEAAERVQLVGESPAIQALRSTVARVANTDLAILILGENGTGKEVVSQMVHYRSRRRDEPFVAVNCAALSETLLESELFGHEKGAFTDAHEARAGKFELASGGTLFLDEIGDLSPGGQAKLLRVLEEKTVVRVGGSAPIHTDARVLAATNQNLAEMVREKKFREDLFFRLNVVTLELPPLRERGDDVLLLAEHFLREFSTAARRKNLTLTAAAKKRLVGHGWPGNIRELRNQMERLAYLSESDKIDAGDLAFVATPDNWGSDDVPLDLAMAEATARFQADYINKHIAAARGNMSNAARRLGLHRSNLYRKMRQLGMSVDKEELSP